MAAGVDARRFEFGKNWQRFLRHVNEDRIRRAEASLRRMLEVDDLRGKSFLDVGCGSGLFSLAAYRMGARVHSFDYDDRSVECAKELRRRYSDGSVGWTIEHGDILRPDTGNLSRPYDVVYAWGVLHCTGAMWDALANCTKLVPPGGRLFVAIYNDQGLISHYWRLIKRLYNRNTILRLLVIASHLPYYGARAFSRAATGRMRLERGMSLWHDYIDWLGGYPFEVARPEAVLDFVRPRGFTLLRLKTCGGRNGCNEFVFHRDLSSSASGDAGVS